MGEPLGELVGLAASIVVAGVVTGVLAGLFGIGGGAVIVPTTLRAYRAHRERGFVLRGVVRAWMVPSVIGVMLGALAAAFAPGGVFKLAFVLIACVIAARLLFGGERWQIGDELPGPAAMRGYGFLIGLGSALMGIAGGSLVTMVLTLYGKPIHNAVATAAGVGVPITIAGAIGYILAGLPHQADLPPLSLGFVSVIGVVLIAPVSSYVAPLGARLAHAMPKRRLEVAFGVFLLVVASRFAYSLVRSGF